MNPYQPNVLTGVPNTLEKRLEVIEAIRALVAPDGDERVRKRRVEIAAIRRDLEKLAVTLLELQRACDPRLRSYVLKYSPDQPRVPGGTSDGGQRITQAKSPVRKASVDDPKHPGWPAGTPDSKGGKFRPKDGQEVAAGATGVQYAGGPYYPPPPPGHDPNTWKQGQWPNNKYYLQDPDGNTYTAHPEDDEHWRHWDKQDGDGNDQGRWPPDSLKPRSGQKTLNENQSTSDPSGDAPPWTPNPFVPVMPVDPIPFPDLPILPPVFVPG